MTPIEFTRLLTSAGLRVWEDLEGAVVLCEPNGKTRAELPGPSSTGSHEPAFPPTYSEDRWRRVNLGTASRTELVELLVAARLGAEENSAGDLRLVEWGGATRAILPRRNRRPRGASVA